MKNVEVICVVVDGGVYCSEVVDVVGVTGVAAVVVIVLVVRRVLPNDCGPLTKGTAMPLGADNGASEDGGSDGRSNGAALRCCA